jgi:hypothetical protein
MDARLSTLLKYYIISELSYLRRLDIKSADDTNYGVDIVFRPDVSDSNIQKCFTELTYMFNTHCPKVMIQRKSDYVIAVDGSACNIQFRIYDDFGMKNDDTYDTYEEALDNYILLRNALASAMYRYHHLHSATADPIPEDIMLEMNYYIEGWENNYHNEMSELIKVDTIKRLVAQFIRDNRELLTRTRLRELLRKADVTFPEVGSSIVESFCVDAGIPFMRILGEN